MTDWTHEKHRKHGKHEDAVFRRPRFAFTVVEVLMVLVITGILSGTCFSAFAFLRRGENPEREAQRLARWLMDTLTAANRTGRTFVLICPANKLEQSVTVEWRSPLEQKKHKSSGGCRFLRYQGSGPTSFYAPQWNTLSPAITIRVTNGRVKEDHYVIISLYGRVRTSRLPP